MEQREAEHMDEVSNQFSNLNTVINIQSMTQSNKPIHSLITLGSRELPYFISARAFGEVSIIKNSYNISVESVIFPVQNFSLGAIKYDAYNSYFVHQTYVLEGGGIILDQPTGEPVSVKPPLSVMRADPSISVNETDDTVTIYFYVPNIVSIPGKTSACGHGKCFIRTIYLDNDSYFIEDVTNITIHTDYPNAWYSSFNNTIGRLVNLSQEASYVKISAKGDKLVNLKLEIADIQTQVGPGWVI